MVLIVVTVHPVSADGIEIRKLIQISAYIFELAICAKVCWICFGDANYSAVNHIASINQPDFLEFSRCIIDELRIIHCPQIVPGAAEILQPQPYRAGICDQCGAPIVEDLQASDPYVRFLDVYPIVRRHAVLLLCVLRGCCGPHTAKQQSDGDEVAIRKLFGYLADFQIGGFQERDEVANRHGGDEIVARHSLRQPGGLVQNHGCGDFMAIALDPDDSMAKMDLASSLGDSTAHLFPHLTWAKFRI